MARISGNVNSNGSILSDTSSGGNFTVQAQPNGGAPGTYRITFSSPFNETPTILVNPINTEPMMGPISVGITANSSYADVKLVYNNQYTPYAFAFAAFDGQ